MSQFGICSGLLSTNSVIPRETSPKVSHEAGDLWKGEI